MNKYYRYLWILVLMVSLFVGCNDNNSNSSQPTVVSDFAAVYTGTFESDAVTGTWEVIVEEDGLTAGFAEDDGGSGYLLVGNAEDNGDFTIGFGAGAQEVYFEGTFDTHGTVSGTWVSTFDDGTFDGDKTMDLDPGTLYLLDMLGNWTLTDLYDGCAQGSEISIVVDNSIDLACDYAATYVQAVDAGCNLSFPAGTNTIAGFPRYITASGLAYIFDGLYLGTMIFDPADITLTNTQVTATNVNSDISIQIDKD